MHDLPFGPTARIGHRDRPGHIHPIHLQVEHAARALRRETHRHLELPTGRHGHRIGQPLARAGPAQRHPIAGAAFGRQINALKRAIRAAFVGHGGIRIGQTGTAKVKILHLQAPRHGHRRTGERATSVMDQRICMIHMDLIVVGHPIAIGVRLQRIGPTLNLLAIGQAIAIRVCPQRIGPVHKDFVTIGHPI